MTAGVGPNPPIVVTSPSHGLTTGTRVRISGVGGDGSADGDFTVTRLTTDEFQLDGTTFNFGEGYAVGAAAWLLPDLVGTHLAFGTALDLVVNAYYNALW